MGQAIALAVRQGGGIGDPDKNFKLRLAIERARQFNMPKENIHRAVERGMGAGDADTLTEVMYEGFAPAGVAVLVSAVTDNKLRTAQKVREVLDKNGGSMGGSGAVSYLFSPQGEIIVKLQETTNKSKEEQELELIDLGIEDIEASEEGFVVYCDKDRTFELKEDLEKRGYQVESAELTMKPSVWTEVQEDEDKQKIESVLEKLEDLDDVQKVWSNYA
jgi:YebC/PmpR family DNA-binding regulatory protein